MIQAVLSRAGSSPKQTTPATIAPVILNTTPVAFANDIDPSLKKITVTFDRRMMDNSWSWTGGGDTYPQMTGRPYYDQSKRTCTMPVKLEPGKVYWVGINSPSHRNFKTPSRQPAPWYIILFATRSVDGKPTPIPKERLARAKKINRRRPAPPYTQELAAEVTPDGVLKFKSTIRAMNEGAKPITNTRFMNSDFVNITAMYDEKGRPLQFTTAREGGTYHYKVTFNEAILPGRPMVHSSEGTMTRLLKPVPTSKNTYRYYMKHHPSAGRPTLRIETFLLPKGAELISTIPPNMKRSMKDGRIKLHIKELIPADGSITTAFQYRLLEATSRRITSEADRLEAENVAAEGWRLWRARELIEAEEKFKEAIKKDPTNESAFQGLGWAQLNQGKKLNVKESFAKCIEINPNNPAALNGLGWIAHGQDKKDEAIALWEKAVTAAPGATASLSGLTKVYMEREDYNKAVKYYQMWLAAEPNSAQAKSGLAKAKSALERR